MENGNIFCEWFKQFKSPWKSYVFRWYFVVFVVIVGLVGVYPSIYRCFTDAGDISEVAKSISTYSISLIMSSVIQILLSTYKIENKVGLVICGMFFFVLIPFALIFSIYFFECSIMFVLLLLISWICWVLANHDNVYLNEKTYAEEILNASEKLTDNWK